MNGAELSGDQQQCGAVDDEYLVSLIIEPRHMLRECLSHRISQFPGVEVMSIAAPDEWPSHVPGHSTPDVILLCVPDGEPLPRDGSVLSAVGLGLLPLVVLSNERRPHEISNLLQRGVRGFIPITIGCGVAVQVLRLVKAGGSFAPASCLSSLPSQPSAQLEQEDMFTGRQRQVIEALRRGKPNKIIAYELNMCESTVKVHVRTIMKKLNVKNRTQVAYMFSSSRDGKARDSTAESGWHESEVSSAVHGRADT